MPAYRFFLSIICFCCLVIPIYLSAKDFTGYVSDRLTTLLYAAPNTDKIIAQLDAGQKIIVISVNQESWNKIRLEDGTVGWIESQYISSTPGRLQQIFTLKQETLSLQKEIVNHRKENVFLQEELKKYRGIHFEYRKQAFNQETKINRYEKILADPLKIGKENSHLRRNIEFLKFDNSVLQRSIQNIDEQNKSDWQTLIIICSIIFLLLGYVIGKRHYASKKASWEIANRI